VESPALDTSVVSGFSKHFGEHCDAENR
jgi:hypothetical protein